MESDALQPEGQADVTAQPSPERRKQRKPRTKNRSTEERQFIILSQAWYGQAAMQGRSIVDEICLLLYEPGVAHALELFITWYDLGPTSGCREGRINVPRLEVFSTAWPALATCPAIRALLEALGQLAQRLETTTVEEVAAVLKQLQWQDRTERTAPAEKSGHDVPQITTATSPLSHQDAQPLVESTPTPAPDNLLQSGQTKQPLTEVAVQLSEADGNAFAIIGLVSAALKSAGHPELAQLFEQEATAGDYDHLLATCFKYVIVT